MMALNIFAMYICIYKIAIKTILFPRYLARKQLGWQHSSHQMFLHHFRCVNPFCILKMSRGQHKPKGWQRV